MHEDANSNATVAVAMSGGVDSSTAAALLASRGYRVIGLTMRLFCYSDRQTSEKSCCNTQAIADARAVCERIGAPHYVIGGEKEFKRDVISRFVDSYLTGSTPNPCVDCNSFIKFKMLMYKALNIGADYLATGHYVRIGAHNGSPALLRGLDRDKDQSYFLWGIPRSSLNRLLFPLGEYNKGQVRALAGEYGLEVREKVESQEVCFVENDDLEAFIRQSAAERVEGDETPLSTRPGPVLDSSGKVVGEHRGSAFYTIGQRKGLGVSLGRPVYVTRIDTASNVVVVGDDNELGSNLLEAEQVNFLADPPDSNFKAGVQIRYRHNPVPATVEHTGNYSVRVRFETPQRAVARGQSVVFYDNEVLLGGGVINGVGDS